MRLSSATVAMELKNHLGLLVVFVGILSLCYVKCSPSSGIRERRDLADDAKMAVLNGAGTAMEMANKGMAVENSGGVNFFGVKAERNFKTGFGDAVNGGADSDSEEDERRRRNVDYYSASDSSDYSEDESYAETDYETSKRDIHAERYKRQMEVYDPDNVIPSSKEISPQGKREFKQMIANIFNKFLQWIDRAVNSIVEPQPQQSM